MSYKQDVLYFLRDSLDAVCYEKKHKTLGYLANPQRYNMRIIYLALHINYLQKT